MDFRRPDFRGALAASPEETAPSELVPEEDMDIPESSIGSGEEVLGAMYGSGGVGGGGGGTGTVGGGDGAIGGVGEAEGAGAAIGGVTILAARGATKLWGGSPWYAKAALVAAAAIGACTATRAFTHEDSYAAEDHAVSDGSGGYEIEPGIRRRMASMNATGDVVFGLHSRRH